MDAFFYIFAFIFIHLTVMLSHRVVIYHNTCKKIATFLLLLSLCLVGRISAQINIYSVEHFPESLSESGLHGPVKSIAYSKLVMMKDRTVHYSTQTFLTFNRKGQLMESMTVGESFDWDGDTLIERYSYDSSGRFTSRYTTDGKFRQEAVYDSLGQFLYSVYTRSDGTPKPSLRYYYDEQGRCVRNEYVPTVDEEDLGYTIMTHPFSYDSVGNCIATAEIVDGDTIQVKWCKYDKDGNLTEYGFTSMGESRDLYFYDDGSKRVKDLHYYNGEISGETIYEYDEKDRLARTRLYDKDGKLEYGWDYLYDSFDNTIECVMYSWNSDQTLSTTMKTIAEFEYYESDN